MQRKVAGTDCAATATMAMHQLDALRAQVETTIQRATDLIADLDVLAARFPVLEPSLAERTDAERWAEVARLARLDDALPERLAASVESLADVLAGLTAADGGEVWLRRRQTQLATGEDEAAAA